MPSFAAEIVMEIFVAILSCALIFALYLSYSNRRELLNLQKKFSAQEEELVQLKKTLGKYDKALRRLTLDKKTKPLQHAEKRFVQVIFTPESKKCYDYLLGDNQDVNVGDFVEVYANKMNNGKPEWSVAKVVYISEPGEVSKHAKSKIKRKSNYNKW